MSKQPTDLPERLRTVGATNLEQRLLEAAGREQPSRELSERMAQAIGISFSMPGSLASGGLKTGKATTTAKASSSLVPWLSGAAVAAIVAAGAFIATRAPGVAARPSATAAPVPSASDATSELASSALPTMPMPSPPSESSPTATEELPASPPVLQRGRRAATAGELANQIALVDAARSALSNGNSARALSIVRDYQSQYPTGTFRPEVAAVKIEALVKIGRTAEARTLAERFVVAYGAGPLADRVARLAHLAQP